MTVYTPIGAIPTPDLTDAPNAPLQLLGMATTIDPQLVPTFASLAARNAAIPSPTAGSRCYRSDLNAFQSYNSTVSAWVVAGEVLIAQTTLGSPTATVTFSSIPTEFTHLHLALTVRTSVASTLSNAAIQFNGDSGAHYDWALVSVSTTPTTGNGGAAAATSIVLGGMSAASQAAGIYTRVKLELPNYADATLVSKNMFGQSAGPSTPLYVASGHWFPTSAAAISSIALTATGGNWATSSVFSLYGSS